MLKTEPIIQFVEKSFQGFGPNKRQEISRLLFEISKREKKDFREVFREVSDDGSNFDNLKSKLVRRRFPDAKLRNKQERYMFPKLDIDPSFKVDTRAKRNLTPEQFVIEESVRDTALVRRVREKYPAAEIEFTPTYNDYKGRKKFTIQDYNDRLKTYFLVRENYDFYKKCACSVKSVHCGYHIVNLGSGCAFDCSYCFLQDYINSPGIVLPANIEDFFTEFANYKQDIRIGSGETTDSLIFDPITGYSKEIVRFFRDYPGSTFEFKTKSNFIDNLLEVEPAGNIVVSWTVSPPKIVEEAEHYTATLKERVEAAVQCVSAGYKVAFHFDPLIHYPDWRDDYKALVDFIYERIDKKRIAWLSIGTLRMTPRLKKIIENRFPENRILDEEFVMSYDGKLRYSFERRTEMYARMKEWIRSHDEKTYVYLCMEEKEACATCETAPIKPYRQ